MLRCMVFAAVALTREQLVKRCPLNSLSYFSSGLSDRGNFIGKNWSCWLQIYRMVQFPRRVCKPNARGWPFAWFLKSKSHPLRKRGRKKTPCSFWLEEVLFPKPIALGNRVQKYPRPLYGGTPHRCDAMNKVFHTATLLSSDFIHSANSSDGPTQFDELANANRCCPPAVDRKYKFIPYTAHQNVTYWHVSPSTYCGWPYVQLH